METLPTPDNGTRSDYNVSSTDASHSTIGRSTAIDYNLGSIHKNAILIISETVAVEPWVHVADGQAESVPIGQK